jgi:hypothetical protein
MDVKVFTDGLQSVTLRGAKSEDDAVQFAGQQLFGRNNYIVDHEACPCGPQCCDGFDFFRHAGGRSFFYVHVHHEQQELEMVDLHQFFDRGEC